MNKKTGRRIVEKNFRVNSFRVIESQDIETGNPQILIRDVSRLSPYGFDLKGTFESGQCFRWSRVGEGRYAGIVRGKAVTVSMEEERHLRIVNATRQDFDEIWYAYFDLDTDYAPILEQVDKDAFLHEAAVFSGGARMLRQDFEETLFTYILSSQNNIPRIRKLVEALCEKYGDPIPGVAPGQVLGYSFPSSAVLHREFCTMDHPGCRAGSLCESPFGGYRCPYVRQTAAMLASSDPTAVLDFGQLVRSSAAQARKSLCVFPGVGDKVADCVLLYSGLRKDLCPIDTWVEKTIRTIYLEPNASKKEIRTFTESYFGENAGYAQLWFFNYVRNHPAVRLFSVSGASLSHSSKQY